MNSKPTNRFLLFILSGGLLIAWTGCTSVRNIDRVSVSADRLVTMLGTLHPWTTPEEYTHSAWSNAVAIAVVIQKEEPEAVVRAFDEFIAGTYDYEEMSKLFVLMRVVFELPEHEPLNERKHFAAWAMDEVESRDGFAIGPSWPVGCSSRGFRLIDARPSATGPPYAAAKEYLYFKSRYPFRDLARFE